MWIDKAAILALVLNMARAVGNTVCGGEHLCDLKKVKPINQIGEDFFYKMLINDPNIDSDDEEFTGYTLVSFMKGGEEHMNITVYSWVGEGCDVESFDCKIAGEGCGDIDDAASFLVADNGDYLAIYTVWQPENHHIMEIFTRTYEGPEKDASDLPAAFMADLRERCCEEVTEDQFYQRKFPVKHFIPDCSQW